MILGIDTDSCGRCLHYHNENDIAALLCDHCKKYYACFKCHDELCDHPFAPVCIRNTQPVMCGQCKNYLTYEQYQQHHCPFCQANFNPRCELHQYIYFRP